MRAGVRVHGLKLPADLAAGWLERVEASVPRADEGQLAADDDGACDRGLARPTAGALDRRPHLEAPRHLARLGFQGLHGARAGADEDEVTARA